MAQCIYGTHVRPQAIRDHRGARELVTESMAGSSSKLEMLLRRLQVRSVGFCFTASGTGLAWFQSTRPVPQVDHELGRFGSGLRCIIVVGVGQTGPAYVAFSKSVGRVLLFWSGKHVVMRRATLLLQPLVID